MTPWGLLLVLGSCTDPGVPTEPVDSANRLAFDFPLPEPELIDTVVVGVDHDPITHEGLLGGAICTDYAGRTFPHCYDDHRGSDFILLGGFDTMDAGSTPILAAADGIVDYAEDGNYDRCHATLDGEVDCDGHPRIANAVRLGHDNGMQSMYWHMKKNSVAVEVGDVVKRGDLLGLIGSSGNSSLPHLHFEVLDVDGQRLDPFAGPYSQPESWWCDQGSELGLPGNCE